MNQVDAAVERLIQAIYESKEYKRYQAIRAKVHENLQLEANIHAYRKRIYEFQNSMDESDMYERADRLERESVEFRQNPLVDEYLAAELAFCRLFQEINWTIVSKIDFDLGFTIDG